jgi:hypothetical protein
VTVAKMLKAKAEKMEKDLKALDQMIAIRIL